MLQFKNYYKTYYFVDKLTTSKEVEFLKNTPIKNIYICNVGKNW